MKSCIIALLLFGCSLTVFSQTSILITDGTWKVLRDVSGPPFGQGTGPNGNGDMAWIGLGFVEGTDWKTASIVNMGCLTPYGQTPANYCNTLSNPIWAKRIGCSYPGDIVYFRKKFTVTSTEGCGHILQVKADNDTCIYLNGQYIGSTHDNWVNGNLFNMPVVVGENIIAVQAYDDGTTGWFSAVLCKICTE